MRALLFLGLGAALVLPALPSAAFDLPDARHIVTISDPQISPDGKRVAYVRGVPNYDEDRIDRTIVLLDIASGHMRTLVSGRKGVSQLQWAPDGRFLYFAAEDASMKDPQSEVFALPADGGEAYAVTSAPNGVGDYDVSRDGKRIVFETQDDNPDKKEIDAHRDAFEVGDNDYLRKEAEMDSHLWVQTLGHKDARRLTSGKFSTAQPHWTADSRRVAFQWLPTPYVGDSLTAQTQLVDVATRSIHVLDGKRLEDSAQPAPHSSLVAYARNTGGDYANGADLYVVDAGGRVVADLRKSVDRNVDAFAWNPAGDGLFVITPDRAARAMWYQPLHGNASRVNLGDVYPQRSISVANDGRAVFIGAPASHPGELYLLDGRRVTQVTHENAFAARLRVARSVGITWRASKGNFIEDGVLTYPLHRSVRPAPLVLLIHGGPQGASSMAWSSQRQEFASRGYYVFEPNYRGGTDQGDRYQSAIRNDNGDGPGKDVMAGLDKVLASYPIDRSRIAVSGWSYGGFMTSWLIGHYHIWKAAVSGASLDDWFDDFNLAFYVYTDVPFFHGPPGDPRYTQEWIDQSPITYAPHVTTPTLIMGDVGDDNVVITNSYRLYHAIKDNGTPVQFVAYPVSGHFPSDPVRSEDVFRRWLSWLDTYLK